jgi:hypothetical protein
MRRPRDRHAARPYQARKIAAAVRNEISRQKRGDLELKI